LLRKCVYAFSPFSARFPAPGNGQRRETRQANRPMRLVFLLVGPWALDRRQDRRPHKITDRKVGGEHVTGRGSNGPFLDVGLRSSAGKVGWHQANDLTTAIDDGFCNHHGGIPITHLFHALADAAGFSLDAIHTSHLFSAHPSHSFLTPFFTPRPGICRSRRVRKGQKRKAKTSDGESVARPTNPMQPSAPDFRT